MRGFFSFLLVLGFLSVLLVLQGYSAMLYQASSLSLQVMLELEHASFQRTLLEQGTDFMVERGIQLESVKQNFNPELVNHAILSRLFAYYASQSESSPGSLVRFGEARGVLDYASLQSVHVQPFQSVHESFKTLVVPLGEAYAVTFSNTGGLLNDTILVGFLETEYQESFFAIPVDFSMTVVVPA